MSQTKTERANCRFVVRQSAEGKSVIVVELLHETIPVLKTSTLGFDLLGGATTAQAKKMVDLLNEYVLGLFVTKTD